MEKKQQLGKERREYLSGNLDDKTMPADPMQLLEKWLHEADRAGVPDHTAMVLSTLDRTGQPSSRVVLLKHLNEKLLCFYSNYHSRKALAIETNPLVAALFFWPQLERQVKITGMARQEDGAESDHYFQSRPRESQLSAWASPQSQPVPDRNFLEEEYRKQTERFENSEEIPRPPHWGGYSIQPFRIEFWQGGARRLHDRIEYRKKDNRWSHVRLAP